MAVLIVGQPATAKRGITYAEVGINIKRITVRYFPEQNVRHLNYAGETMARSISQYFSREVSCEGEIIGTTGIMAFTLGAVCTFVNTVVEFGPAPGTLLLDEATTVKDRTGWQSVSVKASSNPYI